ncbi:MAG: stage III sporulation protein AE [Clostridia bacterium]|nr:stage III sporulation protein AE [Clostridia bacterium]
MIKIKSRLQHKTPNYIKRTCILLIILISFFAIVIQPTYTYCANSSLIEMSEDLGENVEDMLKDIDFAPLEQTISEFNQDQVKMFSLQNVKTKVENIINGEQAVDYTTIIEVVLQVLMQLIIQYVPMFALIIGIGIIASLLGQIKSKFNEKSTSDIIHFVCFCLIVVVMATSVKRLISSTTSTIKNMQDITNTLFPIILTLMTGIGAVSSVGVFQPVLAVMSNIISTVIFKAVIPIFIFSFVLNIIGHLSSNIKLDKFNSFLSSLFKWLIGITFTIFFAVISIQGISAGAFDSVTLRTAKFTISSYVPVMGGYLSQGMDLILASGVLIKNSVGLVGILIIISSILSPILEIIVFSLMLKAVSAVLQPLNNNRITNFLHSTSKNITMLSTCIIVVGFMYFLSIGMCMAGANVI